MARKKQSDPQEKPPESTENEASQPTGDIETGPANPSEPEQAQKQWSKRPDPFPIHTINWPDGYKVSLIESDGRWDDNRQNRKPKLIYIQFGSGARTDQPKNFEAIKKMAKEEHGMYWNAAVAGWAKSLQFGASPLIREQNRDDRSSAEDAFFNAVALEEAVRGPALSDHVRQRNTNAR